MGTIDKSWVFLIFQTQTFFSFDKLRKDKKQTTKTKGGIKHSVDLPNDEALSAFYLL